MFTNLSTLISHFHTSVCIHPPTHLWQLVYTKRDALSEGICQGETVAQLESQL